MRLAIRASSRTLMVAWWLARVRAVQPPRYGHTCGYRIRRHASWTRSVGSIGPSGESQSGAPVAMVEIEFLLSRVELAGLQVA